MKLNQEVICTAAKGNESRGRVARKYTNHGPWIEVNLAPKGSKVKLLKSFRPGSVRAV